MATKKKEIQQEEKKIEEPVQEVKQIPVKKQKQKFIVKYQTPMLKIPINNPSNYTGEKLMPYMTYEIEDILNYSDGTYYLLPNKAYVYENTEYMEFVN